MTLFLWSALVRVTECGSGERERCEQTEREQLAQEHKRDIIAVQNSCAGGEQLARSARGSTRQSEGRVEALARSYCSWPGKRDLPEPKADLGFFLSNANVHTASTPPPPLPS
jgi:hypothetical protein